MRKSPLFFVASMLLLMLAVVLTSAPALASADKPNQLPDTIPLPDGFRPEGVVLGRGATIYAGSLADGAIYQADIRTGEGEILVEGVDGLMAVGLGYNKRANTLFVSGGGGGDARVYDAASGALLASYQLATPGETFINDVIVARDAAYFTDSFNPVLYRVPLDGGDAEEIALSDGFEFIPGEFNANGVEVSANGRSLIIVNSSTGILSKVDPMTGEAQPIDLGGALMTSGDGLVRKGDMLYVVRNFLNQVDVVELSDDLSSGMVVDTITNPAFRIPTTADVIGDFLYAVNARFDTTPTPDTAYEIVRTLR